MEEPNVPQEPHEKPIDELVTDPANQDQPTEEQKQAQAATTSLLDKADGSGNTDQSQVVMDTEQAVGYRGHNPSPVPNHNYTVAGVTAGLPTPETDWKLREEAARNAHIGHPENPHLTPQAQPQQKASK